MADLLTDRPAATTPTAPSPARTGTGGQTDPTALGYTGGINRDTLVKLGQRWYDPTTGHLTQQDSLNLIGDPGHGNRYAYAADNIDPTGHVGERWGDLLTGSAIFGAVVLAIVATPVDLLALGVGALIVGGSIAAGAGGSYAGAGIVECCLDNC